jgi:NAD(P)-dependent dehydrogenase (short-subunit alcohol dehydrogenase family)
MPRVKRQPKPSPRPASKPAPAAGRFEGKAALITGASPEGIGGAVAERMAAEGARLVFFSTERCDDLVNELRDKGSAVIASRGDVREQKDLDRLVEDVGRSVGRIDVLVNNAGVELGMRFQDMSDADWDAVLGVNLTGLMRVTRSVLPLIPRQGGVIVNIASALGMVGCPGMTAYSASKGAVIALTQSLGLELAPQGIRVVGVAPGVVRTPLLRRFSEHLTPDMLSQIRATHPLGLGQPADVAAGVAFLASDDARWITGVTLPMGWAPGLTLPLDQVNTRGG